MRALALALALLAAAGCLQSGDPSRSDPAPSTPPPEDGPEPLRAGTPLLGPGLAWTYAVDGAWDTETSITVVVAEISASGYLLAAGAQEQLVGEICWTRPLFGVRDAELGRVAANANGDAIVFFDFPLVDGRSWQDRGRAVTATEADVPVPGGTERGFLMETDDGTERWTYAPSVGYVTEYTLTRDGEVKLHALMTSAGRAASWVWYERATHLVDETDTASFGTLDVAADQGALVVYAGGETGARGTLVPPLGGSAQPWTFEATDAQRTFTALLRPTEGTWSYTVMGPAGGGEAYLNAAVVTWTGPGAAAAT